MTPTFLPYLSAIHAYIDTPTTAAKQSVLAIQDISESDIGVPVGDKSDCNNFAMGETHPISKP